MRQTRTIFKSLCTCWAAVALSCSAGSIGSLPDAGSDDGTATDGDASVADQGPDGRDAGAADDGHDGFDGLDGADTGFDGDGGGDEIPDDAFYVDKDSIGGECSDEGAGTLSEPWCTIEKANTALDAGDTVLIREATYEETIQPENSGTSETERIVYRAYPGETVVLREMVYCIRLQSKSHVTVSGIEFLDCGRNFYMSDSFHNEIAFCKFDNPSGPETWAGSRIYDGSSYNHIHDCVFSRYGEESYYGGSYQDSGCILDIGNDNDVDTADHNLVEDNTFYYGGHHILGVYSNYNVVRRNTFHNEEWFDCHRESIGGQCGGRNVILNSSDPVKNIRNVIQDNYIVYAGVPPDQVSSAGLSVRTRSNIIRRNFFYHCDSSGVALSTDSGNHNDASDNHIYNNVFFKNGYLLLDDWNPRKNGLMLARWVDDAGHNQITGVAIKNNIFHQNNMHAIYYYYVDIDDQFVADNWEEAGNPGFVSVDGEADPFDFEAYDFHLQTDSPCKDNGGFLTSAQGAGNASTELIVEDAGYFTDGHGIIEPDQIQLEGQDSAVPVTNVDYESNTLTLQAPLSWSDGTGVSLPYSGQRPDQGAYEHP